MTVLIMQLSKACTILNKVHDQNSVAYFENTNNRWNDEPLSDKCQNDKRRHLQPSERCTLVVCRMIESDVCCFRRYYNVCRSHAF